MGKGSKSLWTQLGGEPGLLRITRGLTEADVLKSSGSARNYFPRADTEAIRARWRSVALSSTLE